jgi:DNA polymerase-3 subunit epsilon
VRIVTLDGEWTCPVHGAGAVRARLEPLATAYRDVVGFDEPTGPGLRHQPPPAVLSAAG